MIVAAIKGDVDTERARLANERERARRHMERVERAVDTERARREARRRVDAEERRLIEIPLFETLFERLERRRVPTQWRISEWQTIQSRVILAAQFKAGKTTVRDNLVRSLVDGDPFLGHYSVRPIDGSVVIIDAEMSDRMLDEWLADQSIANRQRVLPVSLRGRVGTFDILNEDVRAMWALMLRASNAEYLILDCLRPFLDALSLEEHSQAGIFLVAFDALLQEAGVAEALVVHHMGHAGKRSRGDSRLRDWPDAEWRLVRQNEDPASVRCITAFGRDVHVPKFRLDFDEASRHLTIGAAAAWQDEELAVVVEAIVALLHTKERMSGRAIKAALWGEHPRDAVDRALQAAVAGGRLLVKHGPRNAKHYSVSECPVVSGQRSSNTDELSVRLSGGLHKPRTVRQSEGRDQS